MTYTTLEQVDIRIAEIQEELDFYSEFSSDFTFRELSAARRTLHDEWRELNSLRFEIDLDSITEDFIEEMEDLCQSQMYPEPAQEEHTIEVVAETVVDAPQLLPQPVFANFIQYLLFITGQVIRGLTYRSPRGIA